MHLARGTRSNGTGDPPRWLLADLLVATTVFQTSPHPGVIAIVIAIVTAIVIAMLGPWAYMLALAQMCMMQPIPNTDCSIIFTHAHKHTQRMH